ncbi:MAG: hypothetical protein STSR0004_11030 [Peptococcaceae bacterium]
MDNIFEYLLKINDPAELKLTLVILARSIGKQWVKISVREISSCKVADKLKSDPPTRSRLGWFRTVYQEKLREARAEILAFQANRQNTAKF